MSSAGRDAAENMENATVAVEKNDSTAADDSPSRKKLRVAEDTSETTAPEQQIVVQESSRGAEADGAPSEGLRAEAASPVKAIKSQEGEEAEAHDDHDSNASTPPPVDGATAESTASPDVEDSAVLHHQLKDGDRIQVLWTIESNTDSGGSNAAQSPNDDDDDERGAGAGAVLSTSRWWGAALLPWDGSAEQGVAVRTLRYDSYPPDFPEQTDELVVFADTKNRLVTYPGLEPMIFRREIASDSTSESAATAAAASLNSYEEEGDDDGSHVVVTGREGMEQLVDSMLMGALHKNGAMWGALSAARQAEIAEAIARKKERLLALMEEHLETNDVISATDMQEILARTMAPPS